jgi:outer membrane protein
MKRYAIVRLSLLILLAVVTLKPALAAAEAVRIGYVDLRRVLSESELGKRHKAEMEKLLKQRQAELEKEEQVLRDMQQDYDKNRYTLSESQIKERQKSFQEKFEAFQKHRQEAQQELQRKDSEFTRQALTNIRQIVRSLAQEEKLALVFEKSELGGGLFVLYAQDGPDLTDKVLARFNATAKKQ